MRLLGTLLLITAFFCYTAFSSASVTLSIYSPGAHLPPGNYISLDAFAGEGAFALFGNPANISLMSGFELGTVLGMPYGTRSSEVKIAGSPLEEVAKSIVEDLKKALGVEIDVPDAVSVELSYPDLIRSAVFGFKVPTGIGMAFGYVFPQKVGFEGAAQGAASLSVDIGKPIISESIATFQVKVSDQDVRLSVSATSEGSVRISAPLNYRAQVRVISEDEMLAGAGIGSGFRLPFGMAYVRVGASGWARKAMESVGGGLSASASLKDLSVEGLKIRVEATDVPDGVTVDPIEVAPGHVATLEVTYGQETEKVTIDWSDISCIRIAYGTREEEVSFLPETDTLEWATELSSGGMETLEVEGRVGASTGFHLPALSADVGGFLRYKMRYLPEFKIKGSVSCPEVEISPGGTVEIKHKTDSGEDTISKEVVDRVLSTYIGGKLSLLIFALKGGLEYYLDGSEPLMPKVLGDFGRLLGSNTVPLDIREVGRLELEAGMLGGTLPYIGAKVEFSLAEGKDAEAISEVVEELLGTGELFGALLVPKRVGAGVTWRLPTPGLTVEVGASAVLDVFSLAMKAPAVDLEKLAEDPSMLADYMDFVAGARFGINF